MDAERDRIVTAIAKAVAEHGYAHLTLEVVLTYAGVSRQTFASHFDSLEQGLVAAQDEFLNRLRLEIAAACELDRPWADNVRAALEAGLLYLAEASALARVFTVEATAASLAASERQFATLDGLAEMLSEGRRFFPRAAAMPPATERALVGGIASIVSDRLLSEEPRTLVDLEPQLAEFILLPYVGRSEASRIARG